MKQTISILILATVLSHCGNSDQAKATESAIKENIPGTVPTTADGYTMKAKLDGKDWAASSMMPPATGGRIIGYYDGEYIGLPYNKTYLVLGQKIVFGEDNAVDLSTKGDISMWGGRKGEMEITKVTGSWVEGKFFFTATSTRTNKTIEVTHGFFRIPFEN